MTTLAKRLPARLFLAALFSTAALSPAVPYALGQTAQTAAAHLAAPRIAAEISAADRTQLANSKNPRARADFDAGRLAGSTRLHGATLHFSRTQAQELALKTLIANQQNPASLLYHKWLTPDQFAAQFGMADSDLGKVQGWLEQQGFAVDSISRSKDAIRFSGTAAQVESAFSTEMHSYNVPTSKGIQKHFAPSTALSIPAAMAGVVQTVGNLDDFRPHSHASVRNGHRRKFTQDYDGSQYVYFAPGDIATVYDVAKEYQSGYTGAGQTITIVGESEVVNSDLEAFWSASGITRQDPTMTLVPNTGDASVLADGDEAESDLDLEWAGAIAKGASLDFVYVGGDTNYSAFDAIDYAIDEKIGTIISSSYGDCETDLGGQTLETKLEQAATQGQTIMSAGGDNGSTDCYEDTNLTTVQQQALAVDYPASSPNVTGVGGTQISTAMSAYDTAPSAYWTAATSTTPAITTTALQYIPEQAWNEDQICLQYATSASQVICGGGGGASALFTKPDWQTGVTGIPADSKRDVPDLSLNAAIYYPGYVFCTSDQTFWDTQDGQESSCTSGYLDSASEIATSGGGTSFATPIFAGMLALINQQQQYTTGQGLINPTLYTLASNSATYASAFHDITSGSNACDASGYCSTAGESGFAAGTGYDQATGLGSVDLFNLAAAWPVNSGTTASLIGTTTTVSASSTTPAINTNDTFTITVASATGTTVPTGTTTITVDSNTPVDATLTANGTATYTTTFSTSGSHTVQVSYSGDDTHATSTGSLTINVPVPVSGKGTFTLSATNLTEAQGTSGTSTITATPAGGYTGTIDLSLDSSNDTALQNLCIQFANSLSSGDGEIDVSSTSAASVMLTLDSNVSDCENADAIKRTGKHPFRTLHRTSASNAGTPNTGLKPMAAGFALAGLLLIGFAGRSSRRLRGLACMLLLAGMAMAATACGGNNGINNNPSKGTYTITVTGTDTATSTITATTTFTFTIN